jgi:hypothetical protein
MEKEGFTFDRANVILLDIVKVKKESMCLSKLPKKVS